MEIKTTLFQKIDETKSLIDTQRSLAQEESKQLDAYFCVETTDSSNALDGNLLTLTDTKVLLEDGLTPGGNLCIIVLN
jgi:hypothetical protein